MAKRRYSVRQKATYHTRRARDGSVYSRAWLKGASDPNYASNLSGESSSRKNIRDTAPHDKDLWRFHFGYYTGLRNAKAYQQELQREKFGRSSRKHHSGK